MSYDGSNYYRTRFVPFTGERIPLTGGKFGPLYPTMRQSKLTEYGFKW